MQIDPSLLGAVLADPEADAPRQIVADWLDDQGDAARASLIRHQLVAARADDERATVRARRLAQSLARAHGRRWTADLPSLDLLAWGELDRGFFGTVVVHRLGALFEQADLLWEHQPVHTLELRLRVSGGRGVPRDLPAVRRVRLVSGDWDSWIELVPEDIDALRRVLTPVRELEVVVYEAEDEAYEDVIEGIQFENLEILRIRGHHTVATRYARMVTDAGLRLKTLDLGTDFVDYDSGYFEDPTLGDDGARLLAEAPGLEDLHELGLDLQRIGAESLARLLDRFRQLRKLSTRRMGLASLPPLPEGAALSRLDLARNELSDDRLDFLASARTGELTTLDVSSNNIGPDGLTHLVEAACWNGLRLLDLSDNPLRDAGPVFARASAPSALHTLRLKSADLTPDDVRALGAVPWVRSLDGLELGENGVGEALESFVGADIKVLSLANAALDADHVARGHGALTACEVLDLSHNDVAEAIPTLLADAPELIRLNLRGVSLRGWSPTDGEGAPVLTSLTLAATALGDEGLAALLSGALGHRIVELDVSKCDLGPASIDALVAWPRLSQLYRLDLSDNPGLTEEHVVRLAQALERPIPIIRVPGYYWRFSEETNRLLAERLGPNWDAVDYLED